MVWASSFGTRLPEGVMSAHWGIGQTNDTRQRLNWQDHRQ